MRSYATVDVATCIFAVESDDVCNVIIGCVISQTTAGAKTSRVYRARGAGAEPEMRHLFIALFLL